MGGRKARIWASGSGPGFRSWLVAAARGWFVLFGVGRVWPLTGSSRLQDSDGDKSDDLVVDVSNEVRAAALVSGSRFEGVPPTAGELLCLGRCPDITGSLRRAVRPLQLGRQPGRESRAGLCHLVPWHTWALRDSRGRLPEIAGWGQLLVPVVLQVNYVLPPIPGSGGGGSESPGSTSAGKEKREPIDPRPRGPAAQI